MTIADLKKKAESGAYVDNNARELDTFKAKYSKPKTPAQAELSNPAQINPNVLSGMDVLNAQSGKVNAPVEVEAAAGASLKKAGLTDAYNEWLDKQYANNSTALMDYLNARYDQDRLESRWLGVPVTLPEHSGKGAGAEEVEKAAKKAKMALKLTDEQLNDIFERTKLTGLQEANYYAGRTLSGAASSIAGAAQLAAALPYYGLSVAGGLIDRTAEAAGGSTQFENFFGDTAKNIMTGDPLGANRFANYVNSLVKGKYLSQTQQTISNLAENAGAMIPAIATGNIAGMLGATAVGAEAANFAVFGGGAAGNATQRAMQEGADIGTALSYGVMSGMVEVITEKMFAGIAGMNKSGVIDDLIKGLERNGTMRMLVDTLGEGIEEIVAEVIDPFLKRATYDQNATNADLKDLLEAAKSGVLLSLIMNGAGIAMRGGDISALMGSTEGMTEAETLRNDKYGRLGKTDTGMVDDTLNNYNQRIDDILNTDRSEAIKGLIRSGLSGQEGGEAYNLAIRLQGKYGRGEEITSKELRDLMNANDFEIRNFGDVNTDYIMPEQKPNQPQNVELHRTTSVNGIYPAFPYGRTSNETADFSSRSAVQEQMNANETISNVEENSRLQEKATEENKQKAKPSAAIPENYIVRGEKNNLPYDIVVEKIPAPKAEEKATAATVERSDGKAYNEGVTGNIGLLMRALDGNDRVDMDGLRYTIRQSDNRYFAQIDRISGSDGYVTDARSQIYSGGPFGSRLEAIRDIIDVARNNFYKTSTDTKENDNEYTGTARDVGKEQAVAEVPHGERNEQSASNGRRDGGLLDEVASEDMQADSERRNEPEGLLRPEGERVRGHADRSDAERTGGGSGMGDREGGNIPSAGEVTREKTPAAEEAPAEETGEKLTVEQQTEQEIKVKDDVGNQEEPRGSNFVIPAKGLSLPAGEKARFKANVNAIKTLRVLMAEGRFATPSEQEILSKYVGWGGLANAFDDKKADWAKEYKQLKGLMTEEEYKAARGSTLNAHYTDVGVIRGIYAGLEKLGFKGGRLLEPSAGVGHFAGAMPENLLPGVKSWTMVELDPITGNIAKYLYPNADVRVQGFETARIPDNYMDMAISNVPFGNYAILDKAYPNTVTRAIHNYFFAKSLDKVRPGGLVTFITSRYTMDAQDSSVRQYIMQRADLLGAIRLPDSAFKGNAGTEVVTDILVLKKREPGTKYSGEAFENTGYYHRDMEIWEQTNEYFQKHPEMVLGEASKNGSMYRSDSLTYKAKNTNLSLQKQIEKAFGKINGKMDYPVRQTAEEVRQEIKQAERKGKEGSIVKKNGKFYKISDGMLTETDIAAKDAAKMEAVIGMRDAGRSLLDAQINGRSDEEITKLRKELNKLYDDFVKKNGPLNKAGNARIIKNDSDYPFILALENYDKKTGKAEKAAIFSRNTVAKTETVTHANTVEEGLTVALNETGEVDIRRIAELTGESEQAVTDHLLDSGLVFLDRDGNPVTAEMYLSGNVKAKLRDAEALAEGNPKYQKNVEALKKVIPADIAPEDISVRLGVTWVPDTIYSDFAAEMLGSSNQGYTKAVTVQYTKQTGEFTVTIGQQWLKNRPENLSTWGTPDKPFHKILEATLNNRNVTVWRKTEDGGRVLDKQATAAAQEKQEKILAEFQKWIWADDTRKTELARLYNDVFNNTVTPKYDGSNLTVNGYNVKKPLREHQKNAVQRIINSGGNTLLAHRVGAGKTYEMAAAAMKLRQLGIVKKPMFVVPKSLVAQWGNEFLDFFPAAKVLVAADNSFAAANRKQFINQIATGDYDAVVLSYEQFKAVPMSVEHQNEFYQQQIDELEEAIRLTAQRNGKRDPSIKQLEKSKKALEAKLRKKGDMKKDVDNTDFELLGVDALFVDEAHNFKNLFYTTNMNNVSGLGSKNGTERAFDLYMKVRYLQKLNGGRGIVFATATPVMNSMSEMYIMQKYLQSDLLEAKGLTSFDAWANQFGEVRTVLEMNPSGKGYRQKQSFSRFKNLAELQQMFRSFADVLTDIPGLKIPEMKSGKRIVVECEPSDFQLDYIDELAERADAIKGRRVDPKVDNMLKITSEGRKLSYTQRMIDPSLPYEDDNKVTKCAQNVYDIWKESKGIKGTQLVFCDLSTPKGGAVSETSGTDVDTIVPDAEDISIYDDLKNMLVAQGIPAGEVAFIHDADTADKKAKLFDDVNEGRVRVLIGSTGKMGVGMNAQRRMIALHHLDAPWRPGDIEQREGRALRQGNINDEVGIYVYITKQTFDSRMWDNLQRKASFIHQVMAGDLTARESEGDGDFALSAAEIKAIASGNPLIMEQFEVAAELAKLESLERAHNKEVADARARLNKTTVQIASDEEFVKKLETDLAAREDTSGDKFSIVIGGQTITERKAAGEALIEQSKKHLKLNADTEQLHSIGKFAGFVLIVNNKGDVLLKGAAQYRTTVNMQSAVGTVQSLEALPKRIDNMLTAAKKRIEEGRAAAKKLEQIMASPFERAGELSKARQRNAEIMAELNPSEDTAADMSEEDTEDGVSDVTKKSRDGGISDHAEQWTATRIKDGKMESLMPLSDIIEHIQYTLGVNITSGHVRGQGVRGQFSERDKGIRTRIELDLPTAAHELGHWLDDRFKITEGKLPEGVNSELEKALGEQSSEYAKEDEASEGLAEYMRNFLQNKDVAAIDFPETTKYVLSMLDAKTLATINQLADEVNAYYSMDADTATSAIRFREEGGSDFRTPMEKIRGLGDDIAQAMIDSNRAIRKLDKETGGDAYIYATNAAYSDATAANLLVHDLTDINGKYVAPGFKTALHGVNARNKKEWRDFGEYLVVRHGAERIAAGKRVFADDRKNNVLWLNQRTLKLEQQYPNFKAAATRLIQFERELVQTWGVNTGLISQELVDGWNEKYENHVPLNRAMTKGPGRFFGAKNGFANQNNPLKRAKGSGLDIIHPAENIINEIVTLVNAGTRNNVMLRIADTALKGADATIMEKIPTPMVRKAFSLSGVKAELANQVEAGIAEGTIDEDSVAGIDGIIEGLSDVLYQYERGKSGGNIVTVMRNGTPEYWKINDNALLESITHLSAPKRNGLLEAYAKTTRFMTANITGNNPLWSIGSNMPRDAVTFSLFTKERNPIKIIRAIGSTYVGAFNEEFRKGHTGDPLFSEYLALGGGHASAYSADTNLARRARKQITASKMQRVLDTINPLNIITFISDTVEMGPRFATYKLMREGGMTPQEAFYEAMDVTVNFRRAGITSRQINKVVPFFNASVQGIDKFARFFSAEDKTTGRAKTAATRFTSFVMVSAVIAALTYILNNSDDEKKKEYQQLSNYTKNSYWCIPLGDGKYVCIPKPREIAVLSSFFETSLETWEGGNEHAFDEFYDYAVDNFAPSVLSDLAKLPSNMISKGSWEGLKESGIGALGSLGVIGIGAYAFANRDFLGKPIESQSMTNLEPMDRFNAGTSKIAYWVGQALNWSPLMIDYIGSQFLGYIWKVPRAIFPVGEDRKDWTLGLKNTYVKDNAYSQDLVNWLYDRKSASSLAKNSDTTNINKAITAKIDADMTSFYSTFNSLNKTSSGERQRAARQTVLSMIREYRKSVDSGYLTNAQKLVYSVARKAGNTSNMPSVMNNYIKDSNDVKHYLSDAQYVEYQTLYNGFYWSLAEEALSGRKADDKSVMLLRQAKALAKQKADEKMAARLGIPFDKYEDKYKGVSDADIMTFKAGIDEANDDGGLSQKELIDVLEQMVSDGLGKDDAATLFYSKYNSNTNNPWARYLPR